MKFDITQEIISNAVDYVNGVNDNFVYTDGYKELMNLTDAIRDITVKNLAKAQHTGEVLERRIERYADKRDSEIMDGTAFADIDGDYDCNIAGTIICLLKEKNCPDLSKTKVIDLIFLAYAAWLESHRQRITVDRPLWVNWGPQFWKISKYLDKCGLNGSRADTQAVGAICNGGLYDCLDNIVNKYGNLSAQTLSNKLKEQRPLTEAGKLGTNTRIKDADIYYWQQQRKAK